MFKSLKLKAKHIIAIVVLATAMFLFVVLKLKSGDRAVRKAQASVVRSRLRMVEQYSDLVKDRVESNNESVAEKEAEIAELEKRIAETEEVLKDETREIANSDIAWIDDFFASRGM